MQKLNPYNLESEILCNPIFIESEVEPGDSLEAQGPISPPAVFAAARSAQLGRSMHTIIQAQTSGL